MVVYGYIRVSTDQQDSSSQKGEILLKANELKIGTDVVWIDETASGTIEWRKRVLGTEFEKMVNNDIIITTEISRLGRSILSVMNFVAECVKKNIQIYCTKHNFKIDGTIESQTIIFAFSLASQIERDLISQRTKAGLKLKKDQGVKLGRPAGSFVLLEHKDVIKTMIDDGYKLNAIAKKYDVSSNTLYKFIKSFF